MSNLMKSDGNEIRKIDEFIGGLREFVKTLGKLDLSKHANILVKDSTKVDLSVFNEENLQYVEEQLQQIDKELNSFTKRNTNFIMTFLNLSLLFPPTSPERQAWQILAQAERKREALRENYFRILRSISKIERLKKRLDEVEDEQERINIEILIKEEMSQLASSMYYYRSAFAELGNLMSMYEQMKKKGLVPEDWTEKDFEKAEVKSHLHEAFRQLMRSIIKFNGRGWDQGALEYVERLGVHPLSAYKFAMSYYQKWLRKMTEGEDITIEDWWEYLEEAEKKFGKEIYKVLDRLGLNNYYDERFIYKGLEHKEEGDDD